MKRFCIILICVFISFCALATASCKKSEGGSLFVLLSVRLKGNGDGTVTAVAQNEFTLGYSVLPISLTVYSSEIYQTDVALMQELESVSSEGLDLLKTLSVVVAVETESYLCARVVYTVNNTPRYIQSDTVFYGTDGNRK